MLRRVGLLLVAVVLALVGTGLVFAYASGADSRAMAGQQPVKVLVAVGLVPAETSAAAAQAQGLLELRSLPRRAVPEGAVRDVADLDGRVAGSEIFPGEVVLPGRFVDPTVTGVLNIPAGMLAVSVELTDPGRVAGFVVPGSEVAIFDTFDLSEEASGGGEVEQATRLLLPRVKVLAAGPRSVRSQAVQEQAVQEQAQSQAPVEETPVATSVLTVAVDQAGAEKLVHATQTGTVSFGLLTSSSTTGPSAGVDNSSLFQ